MRIRRFLLAGVLVGCAAVAVVPQSAFAATDHNKEVFDCVEKAINNNIKGKNHRDKNSINSNAPSIIS